MKVAYALLLCILLSTSALPQARRDIFERAAEVEFGGGEKIVAHRLVAGENRLVLVGPKSVRVLDLSTARLTGSLAVDVPEATEFKPRLISPDGRRMLVYGNHFSWLRKDNVRRGASVWDLRTGRRVADLDTDERFVRDAAWSGNGRTFVTSVYRYGPLGVDATSVEVSFRDGETMELKSKLPSNKISWSHMTGDGEVCFYSVGDAWKFALPEKWMADEGGPLYVWDVGAGKILQTVPPDFEREMSAVAFTPDERLLTFVAKPPGANTKERRLAVWEVETGGASRITLRPKYEIKPAAKISGLGAFSDRAGRLLSLYADKSLQIYETATGEKKYELANLEIPDGWLNGNIFYADRLKTLTAYEAATGRELYTRTLVYKLHEQGGGYYDAKSGAHGAPGRRVVDDYTRIVPHSGGKIFMTWSARYVEVYDAATGELLQRLVAPQADDAGKKPSGKRLVSEAGWSEDGGTLYVIDHEQKKVSLWRLAGS